METELRRRGVNLNTPGMAVIAFGGWNILKALLHVWVAPQLAARGSEAELSPLF